MSTQIRLGRRGSRVHRDRPAAQSPASKRGHGVAPAFGRLLGGAIEGMVHLATASRTGQVCAALVVNMAAFSLWWMLCCVSGPPAYAGVRLLYYPLALFLAHPVVLLILGARLAEGAMLAAGRERVDLQTLQSLPQRELVILQHPLPERTKG